MFKSLCYSAIACTFSNQILAVKLTSTQEEASETLSLQAQLAVPVSVRIGDASFTTSCEACEVCPEPEQIFEEPIEEIPEEDAIEVFDDDLTDFVEPVIETINQWKRKASKSPKKGKSSKDKKNPSLSNKTPKKIDRKTDDQMMDNKRHSGENVAQKSFDLQSKDGERVKS